MSKKHSAIYAKAAEMLEAGYVMDPGQGSCSAIAEAAHPEMHRVEAYLKEEGKALINDYERLFEPDDAGTRLYWGVEWGDIDERRDCRILALCFMAAIAAASDA